MFPHFQPESVLPDSQTLIDSTIESKGESPHREFIAHFLYADFSQRSYNGREWTYTPPSFSFPHFPNRE